MKTIKTICLIALLALASGVNAQDFKMTFGNVEIEPGKTADLKVTFESSVTIAGWQMFLYLPEGIEILMDEDEEYAIELSSLHHKKHGCDVTKATDGSMMLVMTGGTKTYEMSGNSGDLCTITLKASDTFAGSATVNVKTIRISDKGGKAYSQDDTSFTIAAKASAPVVKVTVNDATRTYGATNPEFSYTYTAEPADFDLTGLVTLSCDATPTSGVGDYAIKATCSSADIIFESVDGKLTITPASLVITADDATRSAGEDNPAFTFTAKGFVNNETIKVLTKQPVLTTEASKDSPAGSYDIVPSGAVAANYDISYVNGTLTVKAVIVDDKGEEYTVEDETQVTFTGVQEQQQTQEPVTACDIPESVEYGGKTYNVTAIAPEAFKDNKTIETVSIPASITSIGENAFSGCTGLKTLVVKILVPLALPASPAAARALAPAADGVFAGVDFETCELYVPDASVEAYKAAEGWKQFKHILPISTLGIMSVQKTSADKAAVYDLNGRKVREAGATLEGLPKGIYVVGGRKVVK